MKICAAQIRSIKGDIKANIALHVDCIQEAQKHKADLIFFPELSITGYEPFLANKLQTEVNDTRFDIFQKRADHYHMTVCVGMPMSSGQNPFIGMLMFQPFIKRLVYHKQLIHEDEVPFFSRGSDQLYLNLDQITLAMGICYESTQRSHIKNALNGGAQIYLSSVAKEINGIEKAFEHFTNVSKEFRVPVIMANGVGPADNFINAGKSAVWNRKGDLVDYLDSETEGLLMYDSNEEIVKKILL
ncbi:MAG: carbon-nitrogen hydrolase family protein [Flavobacteriales bacterium]|nr:carbon-nitrogen hydrolase family protein [Flavobacteriales bacterium]